ncbi:MAG: hypothetical protein EB111_05905, partial [Actinobacteria bacterium]|nr:hypothetical protein [Actinomycetota bacterium]
MSAGATLQVAAAVTSAEPLTIAGSGSGNDSGSGTGSIRVISDNDYALFYGDSSNATSLKHQNNVGWGAQQAAAASINISDAGSYIYIVQMGGGGTEDIGGALNNVDITTLSGIQRATAGTACGGGTSAGWFLITSCITGYNSSAVAGGTQNVTLANLQTALSGATWGSMPAAKTSGVGSDATYENGTRIGRAFDTPENQAVVIRIPTTSVVAAGAIYYTANGTLSGTVALAGNSKVQVLDSVTGTITGVISGGYGVTKGGSGTLALPTANTYTGSTTVSAGVVAISNATALGDDGSTRSSTAVSSGAAVSISGGITVTEPFTIVGTGVGSTGAVVSTSGNNSVTGLVTLSGNATVGNTETSSTFTFDVTSGSSFDSTATPELAFAGVGDFVVKDAIVTP